MQNIPIPAERWRTASSFVLAAFESDSAGIKGLLGLLLCQVFLALLLLGLVRLSGLLEALVGVFAHVVVAGLVDLSNVGIFVRVFVVARLSAESQLLLTSDSQSSSAT